MLRCEIDNAADDALNPERHADEFASDLILPSYLLRPRLQNLRHLTLARAREIAGGLASRSGRGGGSGLSRLFHRQRQTLIKASDAPVAYFAHAKA